MSTPFTTDTSSPSAAIVSDDMGNLDGSWLSANYPLTSPILSIAFDRARTLTKSLIYTAFSKTQLQYQNQQGVTVPAQTDMVGKPLPRFPYDGNGNCLGLLVDPSVEWVWGGPGPVNPGNWLGTASGSGTTLVEGYLPSDVPSGNTVHELWRFQLDAQHYLVLGYTPALRNDCQLGLYLTNGSLNVSAQIVAMSSVILPMASLYKVAIAYTFANNVLTLSGFAVNGSSALAMGQVGAVLPTGVMSFLNLSSGNVPLIFTKLAGYAQALATPQLKYLTAV